MTGRDNAVEEDEDKRTTSIGLFNYAESYWKAASALKSGKLKTTHPDSPISFLYYHAVELYLKSFLRLRGHSARELRNPRFGHKIRRLYKRAATLGLSFTNEDIGMFEFIAATDALMRSRYIVTGYFRVPSLEALDQTCSNLHEGIGAALKMAGEPVRGIRTRQY